MFRFIVENPLSLQKFILWRKNPVNVYNSSDFLTIKIRPEVIFINVNITEFVVTLLRFLGAGTLPFCFAGAIQLAHCDACSMQISQGAARSPAISREQRELARSTLHPALWLIPVLNMHKLYWPSETKWQRTCSWESDEYHNEFGDIYVYFTSCSILMVRKSEEY